MAIFGEKVSKKEYEQLENEFKKLTRDYEKLADGLENEKEKIRRSFDYKFQNQNNEKIELEMEFKKLKKLHDSMNQKYTNELIVALEDLINLQRDYKSVMKEDNAYIYIKGEDYRNPYSDESLATNSLKIYRDLGIIKTGKNALTKTKRFGKESERYIWFEKKKILAIEKYFKKTV
jgi:hypothetical protein